MRYMRYMQYMRLIRWRNRRRDGDTPSLAPMVVIVRLGLKFEGFRQRKAPFPRDGVKRACGRMEPIGIEPTTSSMRPRRSPN